jgi:hypothetical protein
MQALGVGLSERNEMTDAERRTDESRVLQRRSEEDAMTEQTETAQRTISYDDYLKLEGLFVLAREHTRQLKIIEATTAALVGAENDGYDYYGHASDAVYNEMSVREMLGKLSVLVADPES